MSVLVNDTVFLGSGSQINPKKLVDGIGVHAQDLDTSHGDLRGLKEASGVHTLTGYGDSSEGGGGESYEDYLVLLLLGDGTDGSSTIIDSSPYAHTVTPHGVVEISTDEAKYDASSIYIRGDVGHTDYATIPNSSVFRILGDFTLEAWVFLVGSPSAEVAFLSLWTTFGGQLSFFFGTNSSRQLCFFPSNGLGAGYYAIKGGTIPLSTWTHVAACRVGITTKIFIDGVEVYSDAVGIVGAPLGPSSALLVVGGTADFNGIVSECYFEQMRFLNGIGIYADDFTPPTGPFVGVDTPPVQQNWIYRMGRETPSDTEFWLASENDGDAARSLLASDPDERTYITGAMFDIPSYTDNTFLGSTPYPTGGYDLGIPVPTAGFSVAVVSAGTGNVETRAYVWTFVRTNGDEGPPSEAFELDCAGGSSASITGMTALPSGDNSDITLRRAYVSIGGDFELVDEVAIGTTTATDDGSTRGAILQTGGSDSKPAWLPPPDTMKGIIELWNGMHGGFDGKQYLASVPFNPHGWPVEYRRQVPDTIVGTAKWGQNWLLATTGIPRVVNGSSPVEMDDSPIYNSQACVSKRSVVGVGHGVCWAGPLGLSYHGQKGSGIITESIIDLDVWRALLPETIIGACWGDWYIGFYDDGTKAGFMINTVQPAGVIWLTQGAYAIFTDPINGSLYLLTTDNVILKWNDGAVQNATFKSPNKRLTRKTNPGAARIIATTYPVTFSMWADGVQKVNARTISNSEGFKLPGGYTANELQHQVVGTGPIEAVMIAEETADL